MSEETLGGEEYVYGLDDNYGFMGVNLSLNSFNELRFVKYEWLFTCQLYLN